MLTEAMKALFAAKNLTAYREVNQQFHELIYLSSQRVYLIQNLDKLWSSFPTLIQGNFPQSGNQLYQDLDRRDYEEHHEIIKSLKNRDPEAAEAAIKKHIDHAGKDLIKNLISAKAKEVKE